MKKKPPDPRRRHLSSEDEELWQHAAASLKPLKRKRPRVHASAESVDDDDDKPALRSLKSKPAPQPGAGSRQHAVVDKPASAPPPPAKAPALNLFDRKAARRLRQGSIEIEARIDLHGLRQGEAHSALRRFLLSCYGRGQRWVLVITGKGAPRRRNQDDGAYSDAGERGVLKRNVPMWLAEPELRAIVVSFTTAAISHGGEGALYIQLRNSERGLNRS